MGIGTYLAQGLLQPHDGTGVLRAVDGDVVDGQRGIGLRLPHVSEGITAPDERGVLVDGVRGEGDLHELFHLPLDVAPVVGVAGGDLGGRA